MLSVFFHYLKLLIYKKSKVKLKKSKFKVKKNLIVPVNYDEKEHSKCPICLDPIMYTYALYKTNCNHTFHRSCLEKWLKVNNTCPCCRKKNIKLIYKFID